MLINYITRPDVLFKASPIKYKGIYVIVRQDKIHDYVIDLYEELIDLDQGTTITDSVPA